MIKKEIELFFIKHFFKFLRFEPTTSRSFLNFSKFYFDLTLTKSATYS
jgi:hypothetical protein